MDIQIPIAPLGIMTLLAFFAPYGVAVINHPGWKAGSKRLVSIITSIALALVVTILYYWMTGEPLPSWPVLILLSFVVSQASFTLLWKSVKKVEGKRGITK